LGENFPQASAAFNEKARAPWASQVIAYFAGKQILRNPGLEYLLTFILPWLFIDTVYEIV